MGSFFSSQQPRISALPAAELKARLQGKNILIVGGTAGIGKALAEACLAKGAHVSIVGRRTPDASLRDAQFFAKDLSWMRNARSLVEDLGPELVRSLDIVVFTNGITATPERRTSAEGIELDLAVSYLSRFVILQRLTEEKRNWGTKRSDTTVRPRLFIMGFPGNSMDTDLEDFNAEKSYSPMPVHLRTVVSNEALVRQCADWAPPWNVYGLNPGLIFTEIRDSFLGKGSMLSTIVEFFIRLLCPSAKQYAENTLLSLLVSPELEDKNKALLDPKRKLLTPNPFLSKPGNHERFMEESNRLAKRALSAKVE